MRERKPSSLRFFFHTSTVEFLSSSWEHKKCKINFAKFEILVRLVDEIRAASDKITRAACEYRIKVTSDIAKSRKKCEKNNSEKVTKVNKEFSSKSPCLSV